MHILGLLEEMLILGQLNQLDRVEFLGLRIIVGLLVITLESVHRMG